MDCQTVLITKTCRASADGTRVRQYLQGCQYDLPTDLAKMIVEDLASGVYANEPLIQEPPVVTTGKTTKPAKPSKVVEIKQTVTPPWGKGE